MRWTILGCGSSYGVPVIGCTCTVCSSTHHYNQRMRTAAWIQTGNTSILIDAGPDLRTQALRFGLTAVDAVLLTHHHQDHIGGIDDLRPFAKRRGSALPLYGPAATLEQVQVQYSYAFSQEVSQSSRPNLIPCVIDRAAFKINELTIQPIPLWHGDWDIRGFRIGNVAYLTDVGSIPEASFELLQQLDLLILSAPSHNPHPLHITVEGALHLIENIQPRQTRLTHLSHHLDYQQLSKELPQHVQLAYDGWVFEA